MPVGLTASKRHGVYSLQYKQGFVWKPSTPCNESAFIVGDLEGMTLIVMR